MFTLVQRYNWFNTTRVSADEVEWIKHLMMFHLMNYMLFICPSVIVITAVDYLLQKSFLCLHKGKLYP